MAPALEATVDYRTIKAREKARLNLRRISSAWSETARWQQRSIHPNFIDSRNRFALIYFR